ncbi:hypothetical protein E4N62_21450 [Streptomyces sp. MNU76]|uniref:hypothetical protein n=1 Tax=Streptomyces sp. MNU76 TaxID=2560026 RepID=UPI001E5DF59C|nr:hypothetical protein [Streptomyces sp. MNU76]MCC9707623.1 hypothetical protein [Streptomyces sp. MNU76]
MLWGFLTPAISDRIGRKPTMIAFSATAALCPLAIVYVSDPVLLGLVIVLTYTGLGCFTLFMAHRLPEAVSLEQAALFEPASVALHALRRAGTAPETVAVVGLGPVLERLGCGFATVVGAEDGHSGDRAQDDPLSRLGWFPCRR